MDEKTYRTPIQIVDKCICPVCHTPNLAYRQTEHIFARLDKDGMPSDFVCESDMIFHCLNCGFTTDDYICTDEGYCYNPYDNGDYIKKRHSHNLVNPNPILITENNPFMRELPSKETDINE